MATEALNTIRGALAGAAVADAQTLETALKTVRDLCTGNSKWKAAVLQEGLREMLLRLCTPTFQCVHELVLVLLTLLPNDAAIAPALSPVRHVDLLQLVKEFFASSLPKRVELALRTVIQYQSELQARDDCQIVRSVCRQLHTPVSARSKQLAVHAVSRFADNPAVLVSMCEICTEEAGVELSSALLCATDEATEPDTVFAMLAAVCAIFMLPSKSNQLAEDVGNSLADCEKLQRMMYRHNDTIASFAAICLCHHPLTLRLLSSPASPEITASASATKAHPGSDTTNMDLLQQREPPLKYARTTRSTRRGSWECHTKAAKQLQTFVRSRAIPRITTQFKQLTELDDAQHYFPVTQKIISCLVMVTAADRDALQMCASCAIVPSLLRTIDAIGQTLNRHPTRSDTKQFLGLTLRFLAQISTAEASSRALLEHDAVTSLGRAMKLSPQASRHATSILRDISRSTTVTKASYNNTSLLRAAADALDAMLASKQPVDPETAHALCACIANACVNCSPAKQYAASEGVVDKMLQLMDSNAAEELSEMVIKSIRNIAFGGPTEVKLQILRSIGTARSIRLLTVEHATTQQLVFGLLRVCLVGLSKQSAEPLFDSAENNLAWQQMASLALQQLKSCDDRETLLHVMPVIGCLVALQPESALQPTVRTQLAEAVKTYSGHSDRLLRVQAISCLKLFSLPHRELK